MTKSQLARLDRAREVLSHSGHVPALAEIVVKAIEDLLYYRDPQQAAERAQARKEKIEKAKVLAPGQDTPSPTPSEAVAPGQNILSPTPSEPVAPGQPRGRTRPAVPKAIEHAIRLRDQGQCTSRFPDGSRCLERGMVELDHIETMWCRGGKHSIEGMALRCRRHNRFTAEKELGPGYMVCWEESRARAERASMDQKRDS